LIGLLTNEQEDEKVRRRAGNVLSKIGTPAITPLLDALKEQNLQSKSSSATVGMVAAALGGIGSQAVEPLIRTLESEERHVRFGAAIALVQTGDAKAIDTIRNAAHSGEPGDQKMYRMVLGEN
jgi:HEAT repeat protein